MFVDRKERKDIRRESTFSFERGYRSRTTFDIQPRIDNRHKPLTSRLNRTRSYSFFFFFFYSNNTSTRIDMFEKISMIFRKFLIEFNRFSVSLIRFVDIRMKEVDYNRQTLTNYFPILIYFSARLLMYTELELSTSRPLKSSLVRRGKYWKILKWKERKKNGGTLRTCTKLLYFRVTLQYLRYE